MLKKLLLIFVVSVNTSFVSAKLHATFAQNKLQYGEPVLLQKFPSAKGFTGFATYWLDKDWKIVAFIKNDRVRSEHMIPRETRHPKMTRDEVRTKAFTMFAQGHRGVYKKKLTFPKAEGHFFDKGLVAYEYKMSGKNKIGYEGIKVTLYENDKNYRKINPKAYL